MSGLAKLGAGGIVGGVFTVIGAVSLAVAAFLAQRQLELREHSVRVPGTVVDLLERCDDGCTYRPVVEFTVDGATRQVVGGVGSSPPSHDMGETVQVMLRPGDPSSAQIDSWLENWFGTAFGLGFGAIFGGIGFPLLFFTLRRRADQRWARAQGSLVLTRFVEVARDTRVKVNGRSPWKIVSQWQNPRDRKVYRFESDPLWFDPTQYVQGHEQIGVKVDPERPRRYWMDTGFLPDAG